MDIVFQNKKFEKDCNNQKLLKRHYGTEMAKKIQRRLDDLRAASVLEEMRALPSRCHELLHDRTGQLSLDLAILFD
jgi:plasmid maintenance system killer protein